MDQRSDRCDVDRVGTREPRDAALYRRNGARFLLPPGSVVQGAEVVVDPPGTEQLDCCLGDTDVLGHLQDGMRRHVQPPLVELGGELGVREETGAEQLTHLVTPLGGRSGSAARGSGEVVERQVGASPEQRADDRPHASLPVQATRTAIVGRESVKDIGNDEGVGGIGDIAYRRGTEWRGLDERDGGDGLPDVRVIVVCSSGGDAPHQDGEPVPLVDVLRIASRVEDHREAREGDRVRHGSHRTSSERGSCDRRRRRRWPSTMRGLTLWRRHASAHVMPSQATVRATLAICGGSAASNASRAASSSAWSDGSSLAMANDSSSTWWGTIGGVLARRVRQLPTMFGRARRHVLTK